MVIRSYPIHITITLLLLPLILQLLPANTDLFDDVFGPLPENPATDHTLLASILQSLPNATPLCQNSRPRNKHSWLKTLFSHLDTLKYKQKYPFNLKKGDILMKRNINLRLILLIHILLLNHLSLMNHTYPLANLAKILESTSCFHAKDELIR